MRVLISVCLIVIGLLSSVGCGSGPTAPKAIAAPPTNEVTPAPALTPQPCRPLPKCTE